MISNSAKFAHRILKSKKMKSKSAKLGEYADDAEGFLKTVRNYRKKDDCFEKKTPLFSRLKVEKIPVSESDMHYVKVKDGGKRIVFFLHGGAYIQGPYDIQWKNMFEAAVKTGSDFALLNYPKVPEATCTEIVAIAGEAYARIIKDYPDKPVILLGDSAGGGLALALYQKIREKQMPLPGKLILLSPWLDVTMSHPDIPEYEQSDMMLSAAGLRVCGRYYAGKLKTDNPLVSPKFGFYKDLPETHIFAGGGELFKPDCIDFADRLKGEGRDVTLHYAEGMQHIWPLLPIMKESKNARKEIFRILTA